VPLSTSSSLQTTPSGPSRSSSLSERPTRCSSSRRLISLVENDPSRPSCTSCLSSNSATLLSRSSTSESFDHLSSSRSSTTRRVVYFADLTLICRSFFLHQDQSGNGHSSRESCSQPNGRRASLYLHFPPARSSTQSADSSASLLNLQVTCAPNSGQFFLLTVSPDLSSTFEAASQDRSYELTRFFLLSLLPSRPSSPSFSPTFTTTRGCESSSSATERFVPAPSHTRPRRFEPRFRSRSSKPTLTSPFFCPLPHSHRLTLPFISGVSRSSHSFSSLSPPASPRALSLDADRTSSSLSPLSLSSHSARTRTQGHPREEVPQLRPR